MNKKFILLFLFFSSLSCQASNKKYFICDEMGKITEDDKLDPNRKFDGVMNYGDITYYYEKTDSGDYKTYFPLYGGTELGLQVNGDVLSNAYLTAAHKPRDFYREEFDVYRFNLKTKIFTHSYFYYLDPEDYRKNFDDLSKYLKPSLADLINRKVPENYLKIGFDKSQWQCYEVSYFKYFKSQWKSFFFLFTA